MKHLIAVACIAAAFSSVASGAHTTPVRQSTFTTPFAHSVDPPYQASYGPTPFRWGWFGAQHYPAAPVTHRDYNRGSREWHYRW